MNVLDTHRQTCKGTPYKRTFLGCVSIGFAKYVLLSAVGKQNATLSPNFTLPGKALIVQPCIFHIICPENPCVCLIHSILSAFLFLSCSRCPTYKPHWPYLPAYWGQVMPYVSHTLMMLNSSANFAIYCLVGHTFRRELLRTLGIA